MKNIKFSILFLVILFSSFNYTYAHCDGEDGPVITAAKKALDEGNVNLVLIWVKQNDEKEIKDLYEKTVSLRKVSPEAKEIADKYFFDTLVRLHRAGEGASFTGVKPAGYNNDPSVLSADKTIESGSLKELYKMISEEVHNGLHHSFEKVESLKNYNKDDVEAGRRYVAAYVSFLHYAEAVYNTAKHTGEKHAHNENHEN